MQSGPFKSWNIWAIALIASVLLNGILIGSFLSRKPAPSDHPRAMAYQSGDQDRGQMQDPRRPFKARGSLENLPRYLSPEQRRAFNEKSRTERRRDMRAAMDNLREARRELDAALYEDTVDWAAIRAQMVIIRQLRNDMAKLGDDSILAYLEALPDSERTQILKDMKAPPPKGKRRR